MSRTLLTALLLLAFGLGWARHSTAAPVITGVTFNPNPIPAAGATVTVSAKVTDATGLSSVILYKQLPGYSATSAPMSVGGDGVTYTASVSVDFNTSNSSNGENLFIIAKDPAGNQTQYNVATQGYSNTPPSITGVTYSPAPIPAAGTRVTVKAKVVDPALGLSSVILYKQLPGYSATSAPMSVGGDGVTYTASVSVDFNTSNSSNGENLFIIAKDPAGNQTQYNVATQGYSNTPPSITGVTYSPNPIPVAGGTVTVAARVTDPALGLSSVILYKQLPGYSATSAPMSVGGDGVTYTASVSVDPNTNTGQSGENLFIIAKDPAGNQSSYSVATQGYSSVPPTGSLPVLISADPAHPVLSPVSVAPGGTDLPLTINGINFASGAVVLFNGFQLPLASYTSKQVTVNIPSSLIAEAGSYAVTVVDPSPSGASNSVNLVVK